MTTIREEENDWEHENRTNWRGLGLADPIKRVEVFFSFLCVVPIALIIGTSGQMVVITCIPEN
jgi:hypothetical protein